MIRLLKNEFELDAVPIVTIHNLPNNAGGIAPHRVLPVMFDMGTDNKELWEDNLYLGLKHTRLDGDEYFEMLDEFMFAVRSRSVTNDAHRSTVECAREYRASAAGSVP